jgi:hypothetical protein
VAYFQRLEMTKAQYLRGFYAIFRRFQQRGKIRFVRRFMSKILSQSPAAIAARKWRAENPGANAALCANWQKNNPAACVSRVRAWQIANPVKYKAQKRAAKARAKARRAAQGQMTLAGIISHASGQPARGAA